MEDQVGTLIRLQEEGKIRHLGLSEVGVEEIERVRKLVPIVSVQNRYNPVDRTHDPVIDYCERHGHRISAVVSARERRARSGRGVRSPGSPPSGTRRPRRWRSPGCCAAPR